MEVIEPGLGAHVAFAHGGRADVLLNSVQTSRCHRAEAETVEKTTIATRATFPPSTVMGRALAHFEIPRSALNISDNSLTSRVNASHESFDCTLEYHIPTYPAIPPLRSVNAAHSPHRACGLSTSRSKRLPRSSAMHLTTVVEHKSPVYAPARMTENRSVESLDMDSLAEKKDAITGFLSVPTQDRGSRTSTMSSVVSAKSHQGPGAIYIRPSAQLQNMQSISDRDRRLQEAAKFYSSTLCRANSRGVCTPTGTLESISNIPLSTSVYQAHAKLNRSLQSIPDSANCAGLNNWTRSSEWVEPCNTAEGPTEWIEDFLSRKEQADRDEEEKTRHEKKEKVMVKRGNSITKFKRRLSKRRTTGDKRSMEPWRGKPDGANTPEWSRSFSWDVRAHDGFPGPDAPSSQTSPDRTPSPPSFSHTVKTRRKSPPAPCHSPASQTAAAAPSTTPPQKHDSPQLSPRTPKHACQTRSSSKTSTLPKLTSRPVSATRTDAKRSFSTTVVPLFAHGRSSIAELVGKLEHLGQGLTWGALGRRLKRGQRGREDVWKRERERERERERKRWEEGEGCRG